MISLTEDSKMLGYELLRSYPDISHFVTTRQGGSSEGSYSSFNCSPYSGDKEQNVKSNQHLLREALLQQPIELVIPFQTHGIKSLIIGPDYLNASTAEKKELLNGVDALLTRERGYCLCISTADCIPVLMYDTHKKVIAAVHAGWRGTVASIVLNTVNGMIDNFQSDPGDIVACIGPGISLESFEVGEEVYNSFEKACFDMGKIASKNAETGKWHLDLWEANRLQLTEAGVLPSNIELAGICTYIHHEQFFSARRLGIKSGRILSGIMLNGKD